MNNMAHQKTEGEINGIEVVVETRGPEAQEDPDGVGSDVLHARIVREVNRIKNQYEDGE